MTSTDLETMHGLTPVIDALPGECVPYYLASGEGLRFETGGQLWTVIARGVDTGGLFDAAYILGPRGASSPYHSLPDHQRSYFVVDGSVQVWLSHETQILVAGDSVHVPPGEPVAYRMLSHRTRLLFYSASAGALDALVESDYGVENHVYSAHEQVDQPLLSTGAQQYELPQLEVTDSWDIALPSAHDAYFLREGGGEHRGWPDAVNSYLARGQNTGSRYFAVETLAAPQPYIIQHFHRQHTENFLCLSGRVWLWVNGKELLLTPGDFLHAPAGTIHSFAIGAHNTKMLGLLTSDIFEPFFDVTGVPTNDRVYTEGLIDPSVIFGGIEANPDLDLVVVGGPPERHRAPGI
ncbi:MAG TPA: quercetin 2,3-dioxygenase [Enteractinococcus helveticum]|uniref:Quercetin 2,3-dioxygenase n=1 Tax=Enteractinococcus helveticum TaxID=1837282 RepID=A0A921FLX6_9MICC|nr:quercetin 2,3-dioxygenase [Enteractinococcus helveticum]HJF13352.1 quercetin 2,3-dioxygenase [Enteractinococcus helveticum]